eukprot:5213825-Pleurochrysis_carterae.AAC.1
MVIFWCFCDQLVVNEATNTIITQILLGRVHRNGPIRRLCATTAAVCTVSWGRPRSSIGVYFQA